MSLAEPLAGKPRRSKSSARRETASPPPLRRVAADPSVRALVTPEGVDLRVVLGGVSDRGVALLIDLAILFGCMVALSLLCLALLMTPFRGAGAPTAIVLWTLGFFALRNGYFVLFEMTGRAATPGKRAMGLRVASRDGARLRADAVFARNVMREVEVFLPISFLFASLGHGAGRTTGGLGLLWVMALVLLPLCNRDRLRAGDLIAGTWVVRAQRGKLRRDMARDTEAIEHSFAFTPAQLGAYGEHELQVLEEVIRRNEKPVIAEVAGRIRAKIGWTRGEIERDLDFLDAFYAAERRKLEGELLFGKRKLDKLDGAFSPAQLAVYGAAEMAALDQVLRDGQPATMADVAARIRRKIGWTRGETEDDRGFLEAFRAAEHRRLEGEGR